MNGVQYIMRASLILILLALGMQGISQVRVQVVAIVLQDNKAGDSLYLSGNCNGWNPADSRFLFSNNDKEYTLIMDSCQKGELFFKLTRGNWEAVECDPAGHHIDNHLATISSDTTLYIRVNGWKDRTAYIPQHTASPQVQVLKDSLYFPNLQVRRLLRVYLPAGYESSRNRYPVLYMHDGQNLFDRESSGYGEWGIDECLDTLIRQGQPPCIVVGIDNGPGRIQEYLPVDAEGYGAAKGNQYLSDLVEVVKPYIDKHFRTKKDRDNTLIAGSSLGGLISYYALLKYPAVFGHAGIFSPSFWIAPGILPLTDSLGSRVNGKCYFYIGEKEGKRYRDDMVSVADKLGARSSAILYSVIDPEGIHREAYWQKWFPEFYIWVMGNGFNRQVKTKR